MCMFSEYCGVCDSLSVCGEPRAIKARREELLTPAEKIFIIETLENIQPCVSIFLEAQAGAPDAGIMRIIL